MFAAPIVAILENPAFQVAVREAGKIIISALATILINKLSEKSTINTTAKVVHAS